MNNLKTYFKVFVIGCLLSTTSCTETDIDDKLGAGTNDIPSNPKFAFVDGDLVTITEFKDSDLTWKLTANTPWTIEDYDYDWVSVTPTSGYKDTDLKIHITNNDNIEDRTATIKFRVGGKEELMPLVINQSKTPASITFEPETLTILSKGETKEIHVTTNVTWTVSVSAEGENWCNVTSPLSGSRSFDLKLDIGEYTDKTKDRSCYITIAGNGVSKTLTVTQEMVIADIATTVSANTNTDHTIGWSNATIVKPYTKIRVRVSNDNDKEFSTASVLASSATSFTLYNAAAPVENFDYKDYCGRINVVVEAVDDEDKVVGRGAVSTTSHFGNEGDGTEVKPFDINCARHLQNINLDLQSNYKMTGDIDMAGWDSKDAEFGKFKSIGSNPGKAFIGVFDGGDFTIDNLSITNSSTATPTGLFSMTLGAQNGSIKNLKLSNVDVSNNFEIASKTYVGAVVANNAPGFTINNCHVLSGTVSHDNKLDTEDVSGGVGGVVGLTEGVVSNCSNAATINGQVCAGGIAAYSVNGKITSCYNNGPVGCAIIKANNTGAGGIIGKAINTGKYAAVKLEISYCYNNGPVSAPGIVGGIAGKMATGTLCYCYNTADLQSVGTTAANSHAGGILGIIGANRGFETYIYNCYNVGSVSIQTSGASLGGIVGSRLLATTASPLIASRVLYCYYTKEEGGINSGLDGLFYITKAGRNDTSWDGAVDVTGKTIAQMKSQSTYQPTTAPSSFIDLKGNAAALLEQDYTKFIWDFSNIWTIKASYPYPQLKRLPHVDK